ncbi:PASTA domain-containing protein [Actinomadura barringtoniae]|uniref:PASTA domain-containing protein n=1 Tax=Actinomadura barringtoniae TaxID=1427535 RepID=A0A939PJ40_9ACTN|nr:PASTA domain-containing protein [Actinomadura barringtoniae]MBO2453671.1 PASTA domain-containing protein [Actinomadura barringtoniae]
MPEQDQQSAEQGQEQQGVGQQGIEQQAPVPPPPGQPEMSGRTMILIAGIASVAAVGVLGLSLLFGGSSGGSNGTTGDTPQTEAVSVTTLPTAPVAVPKVVGLSSNAAINHLAAQRIPLGAVIRVPSYRSAGTVVRSYPTGGSNVAPGNPVTLYVSAGQGGSVTGSQVTIPYFIGLNEQQARSTAASMGLDVSVTGSGATVGGQQPAPGSMQPRGSSVTLTLH